MVYLLESLTKKKYKINTIAPMTLILLLFIFLSFNNPLITLSQETEIPPATGKLPSSGTGLPPEFGKQLPQSNQGGWPPATDITTAAIIIALAIIGTAIIGKIGGRPLKAGPIAYAVGIAIVMLAFPIVVMILFGVNIFEYVSKYLSTFAFPLVIIASVIIIFSTVLPYWVGKIIRTFSYIILFILLLVFELSIMKSFIERRGEITLEQCQKITTTDVFRSVACIFTGYEIPNATLTSWATFFVFYLLLPFAFIYSLIYGLMSGIEMNKLFGNVGDRVVKILAFVISLYATRVMFGAFLLEFVGYGVWGIAGVFLAWFIVASLQHIFERFFQIERKAEEIRGLLELEKEARRNFVKAILPVYKDLLQSLGASGNPNEDFARQNVQKIRFLAKKFLSPTDRQVLEDILDEIESHINFQRIGVARDVTLRRLKNIILSWSR